MGTNYWKYCKGPMMKDYSHQICISSSFEQNCLTGQSINFGDDFDCMMSDWVLIRNMILKNHFGKIKHLLRASCSCLNK